MGESSKTAIHRPENIWCHHFRNRLPTELVPHRKRRRPKKTRAREILKIANIENDCLNYSEKRKNGAKEKRRDRNMNN